MRFTHVFLKVLFVYFSFFVPDLEDKHFMRSSSERIKYPLPSVSVICYDDAIRTGTVPFRETGSGNKEG